MSNYARNIKPLSIKRLNSIYNLEVIKQKIITQTFCSIMNSILIYIYKLTLRLNKTQIICNFIFSN
jgi:hypothetical protein